MGDFWEVEATALDRRLLDLVVASVVGEAWIPAVMSVLVLAEPRPLALRGVY